MTAAFVFTVLTAMVFLAAAWVKFAEKSHAMDTRDRLGISPGRYRMIGAAEVAGAIGALIGLALPALGIAALAGLVLVSVGACLAQIKLRNPFSDARLAIVALVLSATALALQIATS